MNEATNAVRRAGDQLLRRTRTAAACRRRARRPVRQRRGVLVVVRDEQRRQAELAQQLLQLAANRDLRVRVERGERLVEQQHARVARERAGERDPLALAAGELGRPRLRRGGRSGTARAARPRGSCPRRRRSRARSCAGRARTPGRRGRRAARRACGRRPPPSRARRRASRAIRPDGGLTSPATALSTDVLPAPDGPTSATVPSMSSASSSTNERSGSSKLVEGSPRRSVPLGPGDGDDGRARCAPTGRVPLRASRIARLMITSSALIASATSRPFCASNVV